MNKFVCSDYNHIQAARNHLTGVECSQDKPIEIIVQPHKKKRSLNQNALYWKWVGLMAAHFSKKAGPFSDDDMHDLVRHKFLGYTDRTIGNTVIKGQLISTKDLNTAAMAEYMQEVEIWAEEHGCLLPRPSDEEYMKWMEQSHYGA